MAFRFMFKPSNKLGFVNLQVQQLLYYTNDGGLVSWMSKVMSMVRRKDSSPILSPFYSIHFRHTVTHHFYRLLS